MQITMATLGAAAITPTALLVPARDRAEVEVLYVAARDRERAETFAKKHEIPHTRDNYDELVTAPVDAIYNPLPPVLHAEWTIRALKAGKHVLCEKPFALSAGEAARMVAAAAAADRVLMEAFHYRLPPTLCSRARTCRIRRTRAHRFSRCRIHRGDSQPRELPLAAPLRGRRDDGPRLFMRSTRSGR